MRPSVWPNCSARTVDDGLSQQGAADRPPSFGDLNGTDTFGEMTARIEAIRRRTHSAILARPSDYEVGCIMISRAVFFRIDDWISDHAEWRERTQSGKTVEVLHGDGQRILRECVERTARLAPAVEHALANGLLLRADIHRLYDTGYVTVTPDHRFRVSGDLIDDFHNGREYERFAGLEIAVPRARAEWPDREVLEWHGAEVFRG